MASPALDIILRTPPTGQRALTLANVITDATRRAAVEGDGLSVPGGYGVWPAAGNQVQNGNGTTNPTGWAANYGPEAISRETTGGGPFGTTFIQCVTPAAADRGIYYGAASQLAVTAGSTYTISCWLWGSGNVYLRCRDVTGTDTDSASITLTSTPTRYSVTKTAGVGITTQYLMVVAVDAAVTTIKIGGAQHEAGSVATPYMQSDGSDGARSAARAQVAVQGLFTATAGGVAMRFRAGHASATLATAMLFQHGDDTNNFLTVHTESGAIRTARKATAIDTAITAAVGWVVGDDVTAIGAWSATAVKASINGAAFTSSASTNIPTLAAASADLGSDPLALIADDRLDGNTRWAIIFKGTPTDADAALPWMTSNTVPTLNQLRQLSAASKPTLLIPAKTADAVLLPAYFGG